MQDKLDAGFRISSRNGTLNLQGLLLMIQAGLSGAQTILPTCFGNSPVPGINENAMALFNFSWPVVEGLLRDGALAPLFQLEQDVAAGALSSRGDTSNSRQLLSGRRTSASVKLLYALRGSSALKFSAAQLGPLLDEYFAEHLAQMGGQHDVWLLAERLLADRERSLQIDEVSTLTEPPFIHDRPLPSE